MRQEEDKTRQ